MAQESSEEVKMLPNGISSYKELREKHRYYVDKTMFLPPLERASDFLFFVRPRRFGKSLFLSMMSCYYDIEEANNFQALFGDTWIAQHPTREKSKYLMLKLDFSQVKSVDGNYDAGMNNYGLNVLNDFMVKYRSYFTAPYLKNIDSWNDFYNKFQAIVGAAKALGLPIYLIVDEYDNFTNDVLNSQGEEVYHKLTHGEGFYRELFKTFKGNFPKILMLGVSPVTLDDLTSGYNIATNITTDPRFNMMLGFSETDVREIIEYYRKAGMIKRETDDIVADMKPWYDNYCFAEECYGRDPQMFNSNMVLYYLNNLIELGVGPKTMVDPNTRTDYNKMKKIIQLDQLDENRRSLVHRIAEDGYIYGSINAQFPAERLTDKRNFLSLLYYYGMLTIGGSDGIDLKLIIPNNNVRIQYYDYLLEDFSTDLDLDLTPLNEAFKQAALTGEWHPLLEHITSALKKYATVRSTIQGERGVQGFFLAFLTMSRLYLTAPEMELAHGYCDFFLMPDVQRYPVVQHAFIIELKYLRTDATPAEAEKQWQEAVKQIHHYATDAKIPHYLLGRQLHQIVVQMRGTSLEKMAEV